MALAIYNYTNLAMQIQLHTTYLQLYDIKLLVNMLNMTISYLESEISSRASDLREVAK